MPPEPRGVIGGILLHSAFNIAIFYSMIVHHQEPQLTITERSNMTVRIFECTLSGALHVKAPDTKYIKGHRSCRVTKDWLGCDQCFHLLARTRRCYIHMSPWALVGRFRHLNWSPHKQALQTRDQGFLGNRTFFPRPQTGSQCIALVSSKPASLPYKTVYTGMIMQQSTCCLCTTAWLGLGLG